MLLEDVDALHELGAAVVEGLREVGILLDLLEHGVVGGVELAHGVDLEVHLRQRVQPLLVQRHVLRREDRLPSAALHLAHHILDPPELLLDLHEALGDGLALLGPRGVQRLEVLGVLVHGRLELSQGDFRSGNAGRSCSGSLIEKHGDACLDHLTGAPHAGLRCVPHSEHFAAEREAHLGVLLAGLLDVLDLPGLVVEDVAQALQRPGEHLEADVVVLLLCLQRCKALLAGAAHRCQQLVRELLRGNIDGWRRWPLHAAATACSN